MIEREVTQRGLAGFVDGIPIESTIDAHVRGSKGNVMVGPGRWRRWPGLGTSPVSRSLAGTAYAGLVKGVPAVFSNRGMAAQYRSGGVVYSGETGSVDWGDGAHALDLIPQLDLNSGDAGDPGPLGLPVPPKILEGSGTPGDWEFVVDNSSTNVIAKSIAIRVAVFRTESRGLGWASVGSDYIVPTGSNRSFTLKLPDLSASYPGTLQYKIYVTQSGFPEGPFFYYRTLDAGTHSISLTDADLATSLSPYSQDTESLQTPSGSPGRYGMPPEARFTTVFGPCVVCIGTWDAPDGHLIHASTPFQMENFDPDNAVLLNPAEPVTGVVDASNDGYLIVVQENAISALVLTGALTTPIIPRNLWKGTGASSANQVCSVYGELYVWAAGKGLVRSGANGAPSTDFTTPVRGFLEGFTSAPILNYDPATDRLCVIGLHSDPFGDGGAAWVCLPYERGLDGDRWSDPLPLGITPVSSVVYKNHLYLVTSAGTLYQLFGSGGAIGGGSGAGTAVHQYMSQSGDAPAHIKHVLQALVAGDAPTVDLKITSGDNNTVEDTVPNLPLTNGHSDLVQVCALRLRSFAACVEVASGEYTIDYAWLRYGVDDSIR